MKIHVWKIATISAMFIVGQFLLAASPRSTAPDIRQEFKVLKTFSAKDGIYVQRAYLIEWNGQEVVVDDPTARSNYRSDDTITVGIPRTFRGPRGLIHFILVAPKKTASLQPATISVSASKASVSAGGVVELKVLKVYSAQDGEYHFRAYLAEWNGQEVVVMDHGDIQYTAGDLLPTIVAKLEHSTEGEMHGVLRFETSSMRLARKRRAKSQV